MGTDSSNGRFAEEPGREKLLLFMQGQWRVLEMIASPVALATDTDRIREPYSLIVYKTGLYLVGFSAHHLARRTFAVDGLREVEWLKSDRFDYPTDYHPDQVTGGAFGLTPGEPTRVRVFFKKKVARFARRRQWHPTQQIRNVEGGIEPLMDVGGALEVQSWVLGFGDQAVVLEPAKLRVSIGKTTLLERSSAPISGWPPPRAWARARTIDPVATEIDRRAQ